MNYEINLAVNYQNFDSFKQKSALILQNLFAHGRIIDYAKFAGYGGITPLNDKHTQISVEEFPKFMRSKVNCLIFDLTYNKYNPGKYDKLFIYSSTTSRNTVWYGFILFNTETGKTMHKYCLEYSDDRLYQQIYTTLIKLSEEKFWDFYSLKFDALKKKDVDNYQSVSQWKEMRDWYDKFLHTPFEGDKKNIEVENA